jgi:hypothetical protein
MAHVKKQFNLLPEVDAIWRRLVVTRSAPSESAAMSQFLFGLDEGLRDQLDLPAIELYEAEALTRGELAKALARHRVRKAANGTQAPADFPAT